MTETPLAEVKDQFSKIVDRVHREHERVVVTRNGRPTVVLISVDDLAGLEETIAILSDPELVAAIQHARSEPTEPVTPVDLLDDIAGRKG